MPVPAARNSGGYLSPTDTTPPKLTSARSRPPMPGRDGIGTGPGHQEQRGHIMHLPTERAALREDAIRLLDGLGGTIEEVTRSLDCMDVRVRPAHPDDS